LLVDLEAYVVPVDEFDDELAAVAWRAGGSATLNSASTTAATPGARSKPNESLMRLLMVGVVAGGRLTDELAEFCHAEHRRLVGALSLYCRDRNVAEEIAQDAIVRVIANWGRVRQLDSPSAWAHRVAINLANSHLRRRLAERRATRRLSSRATAIENDPDTPTAMAVRAAVAGLAKPERAVVVLRFFADFSVREVSELLGYPEGTVKTLTARALTSLRNAGLTQLHREATDAP
jgi:RNA polymerase sigma factor (sigma-70 family)